jgi:hypothetical protein
VVIGRKTLNNIKDNQESQILNNFLTQAYVLLTNIYLKYMKTNNNKKCCVTQQRAGIVLVDLGHQTCLSIPNNKENKVSYSSVFCCPWFSFKLQQLPPLSGEKRFGLVASRPLRICPRSGPAGSTPKLLSLSWRPRRPLTSRPPEAVARSSLSIVIFLHIPAASSPHLPLRSLGRWKKK